MAFAALLDLMVDRTQAEFGFEGTERGFDIGQLHIGAPQRFAVEAKIVAAQRVVARQIGAALRLRVVARLNGSGEFAGVVGNDINGVVLGQAAPRLTTTP